MSTGGQAIDSAHKRVIFASSLGTVFEWYDFYLYGSLLGDHLQAVLLRRERHHGVHLRAAGLRRRLLRAAVRRAGVRAAGRPDRPQAHVPDHHRDHGRVRRRWSACCRATRPSALPRRSFSSCCACLQGLALGGEYGGAATYVAEHAPDGKRGLYTSWIQTTATHGPVPVAARDPRVPRVDEHRKFRSLGLAHSVPRCPSCCWPSRSTSACNCRNRRCSPRSRPRASCRRRR